MQSAIVSRSSKPSLESSSLTALHSSSDLVDLSSDLLDFSSDLLDLSSDLLDLSCGLCFADISSVPEEVSTPLDVTLTSFGLKNEDIVCC